MRVANVTSDSRIGIHPRPCRNAPVSPGEGFCPAPSDNPEVARTSLEVVALRRTHWHTPEPVTSAAPASYAPSASTFGRRPCEQSAKENIRMSVRSESQDDQFESKTFLRRVVAASMAGTVVEWYEFFLYGTAATLVFSKVVFPKGGNELDGILAAFIPYAVGFAARPLGGIVFGQLGDRYGRKKLLQFSLLLVGAVTVLMGCLPTFAQIGYWAPALLVILRFFQGFAVGGAWGGAVLLVAEHSPNSSRGFSASWPQDGVRRGLPQLGPAGRVLVVGDRRADRLLHPHEGHRRPDLRRSTATGPTG